MDNYLNLFSMVNNSDREIAEVIKALETEELKDLDNQIKKEFTEKKLFFVAMTTEEELIGIQLVSQYLRLISLIGFELLEREEK